MRLEVAIFAALLSFNMDSGSQVQPQSEFTIDQNYVLALSTANGFLCAWRRREQEAGLALLSPSLRSRHSEEEVRMWISGISNPHHEAFEIGRGKRLRDGRYSFEVRLYEQYTGAKYRQKRRKATSIVLSMSMDGEWLVDRLPYMAEQ